MPKLILHRDLTPADVATGRDAEREPPDSGHPAARAELWRLALSFDPEAYLKHTGTEFDEEVLVQRAEAHIAAAVASRGLPRAAGTSPSCARCCRGCTGWAARARHWRPTASR